MIIKNLNGIEYYACSNCESGVEENDNFCDICGNQLINPDKISNLNPRLKKIALTLLQLLKQNLDGKTTMNHSEFIYFLKSSYSTKIETNENEVNKVIDHINERFAKDIIVPKGFVKDGGIRSYIGTNSNVSEINFYIEEFNNE